MQKPSQVANENAPHQQAHARTPLLVKTILPTDLRVMGNEEECKEIERQIAEEYGETILREAMSADPLHSTLLLAGSLSILTSIELYMRAMARKRN